MSWLNNTNLNYLSIITTCFATRKNESLNLTGVFKVSHDNQNGGTGYKDEM